MSPDSLQPERTPGGAPKGNQNGTKHGLYAMRRALTQVGYNAIDKRTSVGKALEKWRADLIQDLGGDVSVQQSAIIDLAIKSKLLLDSIDAWLLIQPSLINKNKRALLPVVVQRQALADGLAKYLAMLGLERRSREVSLQDYVKSKYGKEQTESD